MADLMADLHEIANKFELAEISGRQHSENNSKNGGSDEIWPLVGPII